MLPPIDKSKTSPENLSMDASDKLQIVLAGQIQNTEPKIPQCRSPVSKARQRFARATLSVLNQVIENKKATDKDEVKDTETKQMDQHDTMLGIPIETDNKEILKSEMETFERRRSRSRFPPLRQTRVYSQDSQKKRPVKKRKLSLATVVNMAQFRKIYVSRLMAQASDQPSPVPESYQIQAPEPLPDRPRFIATLSPEAQFSALKAYEDVLVDKLRNSFPEQRNNLYRVRTASSKRVSFPLESTDQDQGSRNATGTQNSNDVTSLSTSAKTHHQGDDMRLKRRLTVRFQVGMDILDNLKSSQGLLITSPRIMSREHIEPVTSYNKWIHNWANEFSLNEK